MKTAYQNVCLYRAYQCAKEIMVYMDNKKEPYPLSKMIFDYGLVLDIKNAVKESPDGANLLVINHAFSVVV